MNNVRSVRLERLIARSTFCQGAGIDSRTLGRIEDPDDPSRVHVDTAKAIAAYLGMSVKELFPDPSQITTEGNTRGKTKTAEPPRRPTCNICHLEIPPAFKECPMC